MLQCADTRPVCVQQRSLLTYISRIYYPFMVREPELGCLDGITWAVWLNSSPHLSPASTSVKLGLALVLPSLRSLPTALESVEDIIWQSGALLAAPAVGPAHESSWAMQLE